MIYVYETKQSSYTRFFAMTASSLVDDKHLSIFMFATQVFMPLVLSS